MDKTVRGSGIPLTSLRMTERHLHIFFHAAAWLGVWMCFLIKYTLVRYNLRQKY